MQVLLILAVALTAIAVLVSFGYGIHALRLMRDQPDRLTLRLAALNLLEPSVTIGTLLVIFVATDAFNSSGYATLLLYVPAIPLTVMLLAPLITRAESALHRVIAMYGCLRWGNTVALWIFGLTSGAGSPDDARLAVIATLIVVGLGLLIVSVVHIGSSLEAAQTQSV